MAIELFIPGGTVQLSGNPIWIRITGAAPPVGCSNYKLLLKVISADDLLSGAPFTDAIAPDENGEALFDISGLVDQPFTPAFDWPAVGVVTAHPASVLQIEFECGAVYIDSTGAQQITSTAVVDTLQVLKGGVSDYLACEFLKDQHSFYLDWLNAGKFLTNQPNNAVVAPDQIVKLWYLRGSAVSEQAQVNIDFVLNDSDLGHFQHEEDVDIYAWENSETPTGLMEFNIGPALIGIPPEISYSTVRSYTFWLSEHGDATAEISERRTFVVDNNYHENSNYLLALNSLSGVDNIWLTGAVEKGIETEGTEGVKPKGYSTDSKIGTILVTGRSSRRKWKINTGWKSAAEMLALVDVYLSTHLWLYVDGRLVPVIITNGDQLITNSMEDVHSAELELKEAHSSRFL